LECPIGFPQKQQSPAFMANTSTVCFSGPFRTAFNFSKSTLLLGSLGKNLCSDEQGFIKSKCNQLW